MPATKVTKAIIAAAGFGTRFLPQTKAMPKEMLPLIDKPIIQYVVEELVEAGIKDIIIITGSNKRSIEDHFDTPSRDLVINLQAGGPKKEHLLKEIEEISELANFIYIRQKGPYGNATPVSCAAHLIGNEPFIYTYADDFFVASPGRTRQMIDAHMKYGGSILAAKPVESAEDYDRYGFAAGSLIEPGLIKVEKVIEKPGQDNVPQNAFPSVSGYLLTPHIFSYIEEAAAGFDGKELMIQPIMQAMIDDGLAFYAQEIQHGKYYDTGDKLEYLKTAIDFALKRDDMAPQMLDFMRKKLQ
jgi:UTP--glucose-1-phosphate uridylyltransferase